MGYIMEEFKYKLKEYFCSNEMRLIYFIPQNGTLMNVPWCAIIQDFANHQIYVHAYVGDSLDRITVKAKDIDDAIKTCVWWIKKSFGEV